METLSDLTGIGVAALTVILLYLLSARHIERNTMAIRELRNTMQDFLEFMRRNK